MEVTRHHSNPLRSPADLGGSSHASQGAEIARRAIELRQTGRTSPSIAIELAVGEETRSVRIIQTAEVPKLTPVVALQPDHRQYSQLG